MRRPLGVSIPEDNRVRGFFLSQNVKKGDLEGSTGDFTEVDVGGKFIQSG